jgi:hypothetical protein
MKSSVNRYALTRDLSGTMYHELLSYAMGVCSQALLVVRHPPSLPLDGHGAEVLERLHPFLLRKIESSEWPGTKLFNHTASVFYYNFNSSCTSVIGNAADSLFSWLQPNLPEDLCLLKADGEPWLVSISHEKDGYLNMTDDEKRSLVNALPWIGPILKGER